MQSALPLLFTTLPHPCRPAQDPSSYVPPALCCLCVNTALVPLHSVPRLGVHLLLVVKATGKHKTQRVTTLGERRGAEKQKGSSWPVVNRRGRKEEG